MDTETNKLKYYFVKDGYLSGFTQYPTEGCIALPSSVIDDDKMYDKAYIVDDKNIVSLSERYNALEQLENTDWKVTRHRDQLASGITTSLTDENYQELLTSRQQWREKASRQQWREKESD